MNHDEQTITLPQRAERFSVLGASERHLKMIREALGVKVTARDRTVRLAGEARAVAAARGVLDQLAEAARDGRRLSGAEVLTLIADATRQAEIEADERPEPASADRALRAAWDDTLDVYSSGRPVRPRSANQSAYLDAIREHDLVFGVGPAGTGKTYLAVAAAVHLLKAGAVKKVVLVRPAVEAGEKLGFLPGDMEAKVNPYLRPVFDALHDMMDYSSIRRFMLHDVVEVAPLAFMRGRTLNRAVVILDEAQNTTRAQMKMFLTRMGQGSRMIVTGDLTQTDLPDPGQSGLADAIARLGEAPGVACVLLTRADIVRHPLVQRVVEAYGEEADAPAGGSPRRPAPDPPADNPDG
ncbi:MAG: PhoH family protein [Planctomycetota bacterium]|nr:MAG: PhoH family protein [Planctomycetota bacterium]